jgi:hypothetical protein
MTDPLGRRTANAFADALSEHKFAVRESGHDVYVRYGPWRETVTVERGDNRYGASDAATALFVADEKLLRDLIAAGEQPVGFVWLDVGQQTYPEPKGFLARLRALWSRFR